jgi:hypothetical protein
MRFDAQGPVEVLDRNCGAQSLSQERQQAASG